VIDSAGKIRSWEINNNVKQEELDLPIANLSPQPNPESNQCAGDSVWVAVSKQGKLAAWGSFCVDQPLDAGRCGCRGGVKAQLKADVVCSRHFAMSMTYKSHA
jgi:hypothetical protein